MGNEIGIAYYEFMIDSVSENRKIIESSIDTKFAKYFLTENGESEQIPLYESNLANSLLKFIQKIFKGVINFFKKIIGFLDKDETFKPKKVLIYACEKKIKSITQEEKDSFILQNAYLSDAIVDSNKSILDAANNVEKDLKIIMDDFDNILTRITINPERLENIKSDVAIHQSNLEKESNIENIKSKASDVKFESIQKILTEYKNSKKDLKNFKSHANITQKEMEEYENRIDRAMKYDIVNAILDYLPMYKDAIYTATAFITKSMKTIIDLMIFNYKSQENILKEFVS